MASQNPVNPVQITGFKDSKIKQIMKSSIFAALVGLATAGGSLRADQIQQLPVGGSGYSTSTTTTYTSSGSSLGNNGSIKTFIPAVSVGGGDAKLTGVSDLAATSLGVGFGSQFGSGAGGLGNVGTGAVVLTSTTTGQSTVVNGKALDGNFPKADLGALSAASSNAVNSNALSAGIINAAISNSNVGANLNLNNIFSRLPSTAEVNGLILSGDSVALLKLIQTVGVDNTIPCDQRIAYLLELNGRLKAAIEIKAFAADQLKIVIDGAVAEITRLQALIVQNNADIDRLGLDALNTRLNGLLADLQTAYANYNKVDSQIPVLEARVTGSQQEIDILHKNSDNERNSVNNNRIKLSDVINEVNTLQAKLKDLQDRRAAVEASIAKGDANIAANQQAIIDLKAKNDALNIQLRDLNDQADKLNAQVRDFEVKVGRIRTDITVADGKKQRLLKDNAGYQDRLDIERKKNVTTDLVKLNGMVDNLKRLIPTVEAEVDRHYYYCFGDGKVEVKQTGSVTVYVVRGDAFGNYLRNLYGRNIVLPAVNGDVLLNRVDIFGAPWVGAFGYPFGQASLGGGDLAIGGSFGCMAPSSVVSGYGTIAAIGSNYIEALNAQGARQRFNLGSCSRVEASSAIPSIGQKFYWSGVPASQGFNLYAASCF